MTDLHLGGYADSVKMIRETLCLAETALLNFYPGTGQRRTAAERLSRMIAECDRQRPLGPDGKHGDLHTPTCGCDDR